LSAACFAAVATLLTQTLTMKTERPGLCFCSSMLMPG
jgi:hypothetical protein